MQEQSALFVCEVMRTNAVVLHTSTFVLLNGTDHPLLSLVIGAEMEGSTTIVEEL